MSNDTEIQVQLTAETAQLQAGMDAGAASVAQATEAMQAAVGEAAASMTAAQSDMTASIAAEAAAFNAGVQAKVEAQIRLNTAFAAGVGSTAAIAEAEAALDQAMSIGAITAREYSGYIDVLTASEAALADVTEVETVAVVANTEAKMMNARVSGELGTMLGEVLSGNFGRLRRSAGALANQSGLLAKAFTPIGMVVLAAAGAVFAFADACIKGAEEQSKYNAEILMTGDAAGVTSSVVQQMAQSVGESTGSFGKASEAMLAVVKSGRFTADELQTVGAAAVQMSKLTGESVDKSVEAFVKLQEKPVQAVVELNDKYHFLTASVFDQIEALQKQGNTQDAAKVAMDAYASALEQRTQEAELQLGTLARAWDSVKQSASFAWDAMLGVGRSETIDDKIARLQAQLVSESGTHLGQARPLSRFNSKEGQVGWESTGENPAVAVQIAQLKALQAAKAQADGAAKQKGDDDKTQQQTIAAIAAQEKFNHSLKDTSHLQEEIANAKERAEKIHKNDPESASIKGINFDTSGAVTGGEQWDATIKKLTKEYSNAGEEARKAAAAARKAAQEAKKAAAEQMNNLEMVRAGTAANTAERIQADAAILASATRLYGANSSQQKAALAKMLADEKAYNADVLKEQQKASKDELNARMKGASDAMKLRQEEIATQFALGQSFKQQEIAQLAAANDAEYASELSALQKYASTLTTRVDLYREAMQKIKDLQDKHAIDVVKSNDDVQKANLAAWQKYMAPVNNAFQQSVNGMIQGTQTFKKGLDNILSSILASYLNLGVQMLTDWTTKELAKSTASAAAAAARAAAEQAQRGINTASDIAASAASVARAAGVAGAQGVASFAGAPWPIDMGAPAFGASMAAVAASYGMISSAQGGWERVPIDGAMTELHKDEMVLPKATADHVRDSMGGKGGGGQGGDHYHFSVMDMCSFADAARRHEATFARVVKKAARNGRFNR